MTKFPTLLRPALAPIAILFLAALSLWLGPIAVAAFTVPLTFLLSRKVLRARQPFKR